MARGDLIEGFDYRTGKPAAKTRVEWRDEIREVVAKGGRRQVGAAEGETWARDAKNALLFEVYAPIPA
jgi:hypothetical protein